MIPRRGITLVELIVVGIITAGLAAATTTAISQAVRARDISQSRYDAYTHADIAARAIAKDVQNIVRDGDLYYSIALLSNGGTNGTEQDELLIFSRSTSQARSNAEAEGAEYEIQYRLSPMLAESRTESRKAKGARKRFDLWKRADPQPDEVPDGGGVAFPITRDLTSLSILAYDGRSWHEQWDSDLSGLPHAIAITATATSLKGDRDATARRIVAIDRIPIPYASVAAPSDDEEDDG